MRVISVVAKFISHDSFSSFLSDAKSVGVFWTKEDMIKGISEYLENDPEIEWDEDCSLFIDEEDPDGIHARYKGRKFVEFDYKYCELEVKS